MSWPLGAAAKRNRFRVSARKRVSHHSPRASFVLNSVIHLVTLARRHMLDPRRVGAASPEVARRRPHWVTIRSNRSDRTKGTTERLNDRTIQTTATTRTTRTIRTI